MQRLGDRTSDVTQRLARSLATLAASSRTSGVCCTSAGRKCAGWQKIRESCNADVAQLVEHFTRNEGVRGSSLAVGLERPRKSGLSRFPGGKSQINRSRIGPENGLGLAVPMASGATLREPSGHVFRQSTDARRRSGTRSTGCPTGARCSGSIGPAWTERGRPPDGLLHEARGGGVARRRARPGAPGDVAGA